MTEMSRSRVQARVADLVGRLPDSSQRVALEILDMITDRPEVPTAAKELLGQLQPPEQALVRPIFFQHLSVVL